MSAPVERSREARQAKDMDEALYGLERQTELR